MLASIFGTYSFSLTQKGKSACDGIYLVMHGNQDALTDKIQIRIRERVQLISSCTFIRTHRGKCVVKLARKQFFTKVIVEKALSSMTLVPINVIPSFATRMASPYSFTGLREQDGVFPRACVVAEVQSALFLQSLQNSTGSTHRCRSPAPSILTKKSKYAHLYRASEKKT
jgi:hypothetical protein